MAVLGMLREEFRPRRFGFAGVRSERLCSLQVRVPVCVYLTYRLIMAGYVTFWLGYTAGGVFSFSGTPLPGGAFLTNWTYVLLALYLWAHFLASMVFHLLTTCERSSSARDHHFYCCRCPSAVDHALTFVEANGGSSSDYEDIPGSNYVSSGETDTSVRPAWYLCVVWVLFSAVSASAFTVSILYFAFLFPTMPSYPVPSLVDVQLHLVNSVIVLIEHILTSVPFRLLHFVYPFIYGVIYVLFSVVYWAGDHERVMYPGILDWNNPGLTVGYVLLIAFVITPVLHAFCFVVYKIKMALYHRC